MKLKHYGYFILSEYRSLSVRRLISCEACGVLSLAEHAVSRVRSRYPKISCIRMSKWYNRTIFKHKIGGL